MKLLKRYTQRVLGWPVEYWRRRRSSHYEKIYLTTLQPFSRNLLYCPSGTGNTSVVELVKHIQNTDKVIWSYWHQENLPCTVALCLKSWRVANPDYCICVLTPSTLLQFVQATDLPRAFEHLPAQRQTEYIRLSLLEKYGGVWLDATVITTAPLNADWDPKTYDVGGFYADHFTTDSAHPVLESWFISAPKNSPLIRNWKREFYEGLSVAFDSFYIDALRKQNFDFQKIHDPVYLAVFCSFLRVTYQTSYHLRCIPASNNAASGPLYYLYSAGWNSAQALKYLIGGHHHAAGVIKLRGVERDLLGSNWHRIKRSSIVGCLLSYPNMIIDVKCGSATPR